MKNKFLGALIVLLFILLQTFSTCMAIEGKSVVIDFDEILKQAKNHSYDIQIADFDVFIAKQGVRTARSEYFPKLNASIPYSEGPPARIYLTISAGA